MKQNLKLILSVLIGNFLLAFSVCAFVIPNDIMLGGANGIALFIQLFLPEIRLSVISAVVNVSLFLLGWVFLGWKFAATSLASTIIYPILLAVCESLPLGTLFEGENIVYVSVACAALFGVGIGLVVRSGGSTGGMDIPPCILNRYFGIPVGQSIMFFDSLVVLMQVIVRGPHGILCSILIIVLMGYIIDKTIITGEKTIQMIIISPEIQQMREQILHDINCGVTMMDIETGYEGKTQQAILTVVYNSKYTTIRDMALAIDPHAFIVTSEVTNVNGKGYTIDRIPSVKK